MSSWLFHFMPKDQWFELKCWLSSSFSGNSSSRCTSAGPVWFPWPHRSAHCRSWLFWYRWRWIQEILPPRRSSADVFCRKFFFAQQPWRGDDRIQQTNWVNFHCKSQPPFWAHQKQYKTWVKFGRRSPMYVTE